MQFVKVRWNEPALERAEPDAGAEAEFAAEISARLLPPDGMPRPLYAMEERPLAETRPGQIVFLPAEGDWRPARVAAVFGADS